MGFKSLAQTRPTAKCRLARTLAVTKVGRRESQHLQNAGLRIILTLRLMKYQNSRAGSLSPSTMNGPAAAKSVVCWRFAPACCAAQAVGRAQRRSSALRSTPAPLHKATKSLEGLCLLYPTHRAPSSSSWQTSVTPRWQTCLATCGRSGKAERPPVRCTLHPKENGLRFASLASPMAPGCQTHYFQLRR